MQHPVDPAPVIPANHSTLMGPQAPNPISAPPGNLAPAPAPKSSPMSSAVPATTALAHPSKDGLMSDQLGSGTQMVDTGQHVSSDKASSLSSGSNAQQPSSAAPSSMNHIQNPQSLPQKMQQLHVAQAAGAGAGELLRNFPASNASTSAAPSTRPQPPPQGVSQKQGPQQTSGSFDTVGPRPMQVVPRPTARLLAPRPVPVPIPAAMNEYMQQRAAGAAKRQTVPATSSGGNSAMMSKNVAYGPRQAQSLSLGLKSAQAPERKMQLMSEEPSEKKVAAVPRASKATPSLKKKSKKNGGQTAVASVKDKSSAAVVSMSSLLLNSLKKSEAVSGAEASSTQASQGQPSTSKDGSIENASTDGTRKDVDMLNPTGTLKKGVLKLQPAARIGSEAQIVRNLGSTSTATAGRSRTASEMLGESSNQNDASGETSATSRPVKRMHLLQGSSMSSNKSNTNSNDNISTLRSENVTGQNNPSNTSSGSMNSEKESTSKPVSGPSPPSKSPVQQTSQGKASMVTIGAPVTGVPLLRSSPVMHNAIKGPKSDKLRADTKVDAKMSDATDGGVVKKHRRKPKTVSWASEEKLLSVAHIDTRIELIKSWHPEFQDTLPFAPPTLANFRAAIANEASHIGNPVMPAKESFEASRQRELQLEHDMEMRRVREAKEALRRKLDAMKPMCNWFPGCMTVVLPIECRLENESIEEFSLCTVEECESVKIDTLPESPPSPRRKENASSISRSSLAVNIPLHDTGAKVDGADENMAAADSAPSANTPSSNNPDMMRGVETGHNSRPNYSTGGGFHRQPPSSFDRHGGNDRAQRMDERMGNGVHDGPARNHATGFRSLPFHSDNRQGDRNGGMNGFRGNFRNDERRDNERGHPHGGGPGGNMPPLPALGSLELQQLLTAIQKGVVPPNLPPGAFQGNPQMGGMGKYNNGGQGGFNPLVGPPGFAMPPPPPGMGIPGLPPGMMLPGMGMGMPPPPHMNMMGMPPPQAQRMDAPIPGGRKRKSKKPCKYFGTKQGCRDGSSCMFSHER